MTTYEVTFDGSNFSLDIQNLDSSRALRVLDILKEIEPMPTVTVVRFPDTKPVFDKTYGDLARNAYEKSPGNIILAIKELRTKTGLGLKESKELIDFVAGRTSFEPHLYASEVAR